MNYASANRRPNAAAMIGALGIPGAFGALLVVGLAVTVVTVPEPPRPEARDVTDMPLPPPPPPTPEAKRDRKTPTTTPTTPTTDDPPAPTPLPPLDKDWGNPGPQTGTGTDTGTGTASTGLPDPGPSASPFDAVGAKPKGNPGRWVTNDDYRPRWVRENLAGTARFTLSIDASGRVTGCTITRSTGHAPLDAATCDLVTKRARFDAARDTSGRSVAGSYKGSITWQIPE